MIGLSDAQLLLHLFDVLLSVDFTPWQNYFSDKMKIKFSFLFCFIYFYLFFFFSQRNLKRNLKLLCVLNSHPLFIYKFLLMVFFFLFIFLTNFFLLLTHYDTEQNLIKTSYITLKAYNYILIKLLPNQHLVMSILSQRKK